MVIAFIGIAIALSLAMAGAWRVRMTTGKSGWIDTIWSLAVGLGGLAAALCALVLSQAPWTRPALVAALVLLWSARLALHIAARTGKGDDDPRYADLARQWGDAFGRRLFWFLQVQALCALPLVLAVLLAAGAPQPALGLADALGALLLVVAVLGEALADRQLQRFRDDSANRGRICDRGLWAWSRHPNYFFEWLGWLAYPLIAIGAGHPWGWLALSAPVLMYWLLVHVSGIPPLEAHMARARGEAWAVYRQRVSAFFPMPPGQTPSAASDRKPS